jgi:hypothetical protein
VVHLSDERARSGTARQVALNSEIAIASMNERTMVKSNDERNLAQGLFRGRCEAYCQCAIDTPAVSVLEGRLGRESCCIPASSAPGIVLVPGPQQQQPVR